MSEVAHESGNQLRHAAGALWPNLPVLLCGSLVVAAAWAVVRAPYVHLGSVSALGLGLLVVPAFAALLRGSEVLLREEHFGVESLVRCLPRVWAPAVKVAALPTAAVMLTWAARDLWRLSGQTWMLASVTLGAVVSLLALYTGVVALPYVVRTRCRLVEGWLVSFYIATRNPVPVLAVLSAVTLGVGAAAYLSFAMVLLLPGPLALIWAAAVSTAIEHSSTHLAKRAGPH